jgi:hypothetical protein
MLVRPVRRQADETTISALNRAHLQIDRKDPLLLQVSRDADTIETAVKPDHGQVPPSPLARNLETETSVEKVMRSHKALIFVRLAH